MRAVDFGHSGPDGGLHNTGNLERLLRQARRRSLLRAAVTQLTFAATCSAGVLLLLLIAGTQVLSWYWLALAFCGGIAAGARRMHRSGMSIYALAQEIDKRLELRDTLSTAWFFRHIAPERGGELRELQQESAERAAASADLRDAVPITPPRIAYVLAAFLTLAGGLFIARYLLLDTLNLSAPIAHFELPGLFSEPKAEAAVRKSAIQEKLEEQLQQMGMSLDPLTEAPEQGEYPMDQNVPGAASPDGRRPGPNPAAGKPSSEAEEGNEPMEGNEKSDSPNYGDTNSAPDNSGPQGLSLKGNPPKQAGNQQKNASNSGNSLMDKMRDAMSNLLSKLTTGKQPGQQQMASNEGRTQSQQQASASQKGMQGQGKSRGEGQPAQDPSGNQEGQPGDQAQAGNSKAGEEGSDRPGNQDAKSGMGKQDGSKDVHQAEQLAAMGKISELIGKRAQQISGEITVEVQSTKQQLRTAYTSRKASHADLGAEISRDEIPLMYQPYVQRYFEEVRKMPAAPGKGPAKPREAPAVKPAEVPKPMPGPAVRTAQ